MSTVGGMIRFIVLAPITCWMMEARNAGSTDASMVFAPALVATVQNIVLRDGFYQSALYTTVKMLLQQERMNLSSSSV